MTPLDYARKQLDGCASELRSRLRTALFALETNPDQKAVIDRIEAELDCSFNLFWAGHQDDLMILGQKHATKKRANGVGTVWGDFIHIFDHVNKLEREAIPRKPKPEIYAELEPRGPVPTARIPQVVNLPLEAAPAEEEMPAFLR